MSLYKLLAKSKAIDKKETEKKRAGSKGFSVVDLLVWAGVVTVFLGIIAVAAVYLDKFKKGENIDSALDQIRSGLNAYYQAYYKYPAGSGWSWDTSYAYVPAEIINQGWQYSCSGGTIQITSPPITSDPKLLAQIQNNLQGAGKCGSVSTSGNSVVCILYNRPCY